MILLDPDLDSHPAPKLNSAKPSAGPGSPVSSINLRLPSARTLNRFLREAQAAVRLRGQVSVLLTTDAAIRKLNREFRGINKATDVLSFPALPLQNAKAAERVAGDLAVSVETARKQAAEQGHALTCELKILMLHGLLHLAGYDHETDDGKMARREGLLRARLGLPLGLIERAEAPTLATGKNRKDGARMKSASQRVSKSVRRSLPTLAAKGAARMGHPAGSKSASTAASRREGTRIAQGGVRDSGQNPGNAPDSRARRPVGPARKSASAGIRRRKP